MGETSPKVKEIEEMTTHRFPVTEAELSKLIRTCGYVHCSFGTGDLLWDDTKPIPEAVVKLGEMRGDKLAIPAQKAQPQPSGD